MTDLDPYDGAGLTDGRLRVRFASGRTDEVAATVPVPGVLRLRIGPPVPGTSPILLPLADRPAELTAVEGGVRIAGPEVEAVWSADGQGLRCGGFARFSEPAAETVPFAAGRRPATGERPAGWVETVHLGPDAGVYGGGESYQGIDLRGRFRRMRNTEVDRAAGRDTAYLNVPLLWSDRGWGLFVHTGAVVDADLGATHAEAARIDVDGEGLDLFVLTGDAPAILRRYHALTGLPRPLPEWALGTWMSRSSYFTAGEMVATADELAAAGSPPVLMHVDEWLGEVVLDTSAWSAGPDRERFPEGWAAPLHDRGVRTSLWINPYLARGTEEAERHREFLLGGPSGRPVPTIDDPDTLPVDLTDPRARSWWVERLAATLRSEGASAVLADFGEEVPGEARFADGSTGAARHNSYGLLYAEAVAEAGERAHGADFVAVARSGTAGQQRYAVTWAGDMPSTWGGLTSTLRACLSMALSGLAFVTHDAGGYWTPESYERAKELRRDMRPFATEPDVEPELYVRWTQWAAFSPIMRFHGVGAREPTAYPSPHREAALAACALRGELRPRLVAATREAAESGTPVIRPMVLAYPGDRAARDADLQYLLGPDVLVAPLLEPGGRRLLWVPPGDWRPLCGAAPVSGPGWREVSCDLGAFPAWARADGTGAAGHED
ncbi:hypothetical protein GCM10023215_33110 [Pseudonocardia yuanmonensis]|uniref:Alpha-D-xyloside xylohydrolase n=1 Tax=Pseudonocardia yuanmonensis TaxID=1095914 RepID=A0ABP8WR68_9PSEU